LCYIANTLSLVDATSVIKQILQPVLLRLTSVLVQRENNPAAVEALHMEMHLLTAVFRLISWPSSSEEDGHPMISSLASLWPIVEQILSSLTDAESQQVQPP